MPQRPVDVDIPQSVRDLFFNPNQYRLDDRFVIRDGETHPLAVLAPGGGYAMVCSFIEGVPIAKKLNALGISAVIVYYRVKKKAHYPAPQDDLARAVKEVLEKKDEYHIDPENYSVWGGSAGGHLAATFGTKKLGYAKYDLPKPGAIVLAYPVITMDPKLTHTGSHDLLLGAPAAHEAEELASVEKQVDGDYPRTFLWCGENDATVRPENSKLMDAALTAAGVDHVCKIFQDAPHGIGPGTGTQAEGWIADAVRFWRG